MTESLIDTDILSFYFKGEPKVVGSFRKYLQEFDVINISIIIYYEILGGLKYKRARKQIREFETFVNNNTIIHISEESAIVSSDIYADLRKRGITIGTSDILIAGIAVENKLTLVTNNERHYEPIQGLKIENWKELAASLNKTIQWLKKIVPAGTPITHEFPQAVLDTLMHMALEPLLKQLEKGR